MSYGHPAAVHPARGPGPLVLLHALRGVRAAARWRARGGAEIHHAVAANRGAGGVRDAREREYHVLAAGDPKVGG